MDLLNSNVPSTLAVAALIFLVFGPVPLLITDMFSIDINTSWNSRRQKLAWELVSIAKCSHCFGSGGRSRSLRI